MIWYIVIHTYTAYVKKECFMEYRKTILLKDGRKCLIRSCSRQDAQAVLANFILTHEQTDFLLTYPDEITYTVNQEAEYLKRKAESENEAELMAEVDGKVAGLASVDCVGRIDKVRHRAEFGISIDREYWHLGIGEGLTASCIECAGKAGYKQLELGVLQDNLNAIALYKKTGFQEFGRNPRGFRSRDGKYHEVILMRLELDT